MARVKSVVETRHRAGLEPQLFGRRERVFPHREARPRAAGIEPEYGAWAWEIHHSAKKDAPSGTLLKLVDEMKQRRLQPRHRCGSNRAGAHPGTHEIGFDSAADTITLRHTARSREGFARGALKAARMGGGQKGFYEFGEVFFGAAAAQKKFAGRLREVAHVYRMRHGAGHAVPRTVAG
jgi:hypothetical protein